MNTPESRRQLGIARDVLSGLAQQVPVPGITAGVAITLLGLGLCQELAQRFILEYILAFQDQRITMLFFANEADMHQNHAVVLLGDIDVPDSLIIGRGASDNIMEDTYPMNDFLEKNTGAILVDPFLDSISVINEDMHSFMAYCKAEKITHLVGARLLHATPNIIRLAPMLKSNAVVLAEHYRQSIAAFGIDLFSHIETVTLPTYTASAHILDVLEFIVKKPDVTLNRAQHTISMHSFWLKQLSPPAIENLAKELDVHPDRLILR